MIGVYMAVDVFDRVLYVGASRDVERRVEEHKQKPWWEQVDRVEIYEMENWDQALYVERNAIARIAPEFNIQSNDIDARFARQIEGAMLRDADAWASTSGTSSEQAA